MKQRGRHPDKALSAVRVRSLSKAGRYADGNGLYLIVDDTGAKRWMLRTVVQGRRRDIGLGGARLVSLAEARERVLSYRKLARDGGDPLAERRKARREVPTFEVAARKVHEQHKTAWRNPKHAQQWINTLAEYVFPEIGQRRVDQIDTPDILKVLAPIWLTKPETARRVKQRVRAVFDWAKAAGHRSDENPVAGVAKGLPKQTDRDVHHAALPYGEVPAFLQTLRAAPAAEIVRLAFEFLILTATRTNEVIAATWNEIDFHGKLWVIPSGRMKVKREHKVPLAPRCLKILARAKQLAGGEAHIFPGQSTGRHLSNMAFLMTLRRLHRHDITTHGFRSSFRDWTSERTNFSREVCEMALAHGIDDKTEAAYRRGDLLEKRRELMAKWAAFMSSGSPSAARLPSDRV